MMDGYTYPTQPETLKRPEATGLQETIVDQAVTIAQLEKSRDYWRTRTFVADLEVLRLQRELEAMKAGK